MLRTLATLGAAVLAPALVMPAPALAVDPCRQATEALREAEDDVRRWVQRNCHGNGQCGGNPQRFLVLMERLENARAFRASQCG